MSTIQSSLPFENRGASQHKCYCYKVRSTAIQSKGHKSKTETLYQAKVSGSPGAQQKPSGAIWRWLPAEKCGNCRATEILKYVGLCQWMRRKRRVYPEDRRQVRPQKERGYSTWVTWGCDSSFNKRLHNPGSLRSLKKPFTKCLRKPWNKYLEELWIWDIFKL